MDPSAPSNQEGYPDPEAALAETLTGHAGRAAPPVGATQYGRYQLGNRLGAGGMGIVYEAYDPDLDRRVALKVIGQRQRALGSEAQARLLREARAMARLAHPNVIAIHDVGTVGDEAFVAMELVQGRTLKAWLQQTAPSRGEILNVFVQAGRGLAAAHSAGLVHRDFKPSNVMIGDDGRVRVLDFGLARLAESADPLAEAARVGSPALEELTRTGGILGTPAYMAPEQCRGDEVDARTDQFSFCVALFEALYGVAPFEGDSVEARLGEIEAGRIAPARDVPAVGKQIRAAVLRGLRADPAARHSSMDALLAELDRGSQRRRRRRTGLIAALVLALAVGAAALVATQSGSHPVQAIAADRAPLLRMQMVDNTSTLMKRLAAYAEDDAAAKRLGVTALPDSWRMPGDNKPAHDYYLAADTRGALERYLALPRRSDLAVEPGHEILLGRGQGGWRTFYLWTRVELDDSHIASEWIEHDPTGDPEVMLSLNAEGSARLAAATGQNAGRRMAIVIDGGVVSAPIIEDAILGSAMTITSHGNDRAAKERYASNLVRSLALRSSNP